MDDSGVHATGDGVDEFIPADTVVLALGRVEADTHFVTSLRDAGLEVKVVGSAAAPGRVFDAIHSAFFTARLV